MFLRLISFFPMFRHLFEAASLKLLVGNGSQMVGFSRLFVRVEPIKAG